MFIFAAKIRVFCETTKFLVEFLIHGSILADFWGAARSLCGANVVNNLGLTKK